MSRTAEGGSTCRHAAAILQVDAATLADEAMRRIPPLALFVGFHSHGLSLSKRRRIRRRARWMRTRTAVTVMSSRRAISRSSAPSSSRASRISRSNGESAASAAPKEVRVLVAGILGTPGRLGRQRRLGPAAAHGVDRAADGNRAKPRAEARLRTEAAERPKRADERLLGGVLGESRVARHPARGREGRGRRRADEPLDRLLVSLQRASDEARLGRQGLGGAGQRRLTASPPAGRRTRDQSLTPEPLVE